MSYKQMKDGDSVELGEMQILRFTCCDCGLVHDITAKKDRLIFRVNKRATGQQRRWRRIKILDEVKEA